MADPTFRSSKTQDLSSPATITLAQPTGSLSTDVVIAGICVETGTSSTPATWTAPAGWTQFAGSPFAATLTNGKFQLQLWWALGTVTWSNAFTNAGGSGSQFAGVVNEAWSNVDTTTPIDVVAGSLSTSNAATSVSVAAVTTVTDRAVQLIAAGDNNDGTFSATGFSVDENGHANEAFGFLRKTSVQTPAGSTGAVTVNDSASGTGQSLLGIAFALRPAATAAAFVAHPYPGLPGAILAM